ncbi:hypothetical protein N658DRAFT_176299 [Parathielavia hyrcaniae]|uniref:Secreted protein n=1 Tax=Parathielavia hyrcaniae TaxID=113614 RepID=A0AAN6Q7M0_9PEZI|nr:hypothetical protein N658DRAFT_176299 [Parathielavia hyrcaniae]
MILLALVEGLWCGCQSQRLLEVPLRPSRPSGAVACRRIRIQQVLGLGLWVPPPAELVRWQLGMYRTIRASIQPREEIGEKQDCK